MAKRKADLQFKEGKPSEIEIDDLAGKIAAKWERLGCRLGIKQEVLDCIKTNADDKPKEMLRCWINTTKSTTPYEQLYHALCHVRVGRNNLAEDFCCVKESPAVKSRKTLSDKGKTPATISKQHMEEGTKTRLVPAKAAKEEKKLKVKRGEPSQVELQYLANDLLTQRDTWRKLALALNIKQAQITQIDNPNKELFQKAYDMLLFWKEANGPDATYGVLYNALTSSLVNCRALAERYCC